jgi:hypothetical protein
VKTCNNCPVVVFLKYFAKKHSQTIIDNIKSKNNIEDEIMKATGSLDGTWKHRGHISNSGIVFIVDVQSGMCIDYEIMSLLCEAYKMKKIKIIQEPIRKIV